MGLIGSIAVLWMLSGGRTRLWWGCLSRQHYRAVLAIELDEPRIVVAVQFGVSAPNVAYLVVPLHPLHPTRPDRVDGPHVPTAT